MKKITENQLKDKVNSLREYLKVYELNEEGRGSDEYQAAAGIKPLPAQIGAVGNPWAKSDPAKAAAWEKLSPEDQKWLGGADPTDKFILMRAPKKGAPAPAFNAAKDSQAANVAPVPAAPQTGAASNMAKDPAQQAQAAAASGDNPEAAMGAGQYPRVGPNTTVAQNSAAANAERDGVPAAPAAVATPVAPQPPNTATALPAANQAAPTSTQVQTDDNGNHMITTPDGKTTVVGPDGKPLENGGKEQVQGPEARKISRFKALVAKAKEKRTDAEVQASKDLGSFAVESTTYFLNKLRLIESRQLNEVLSAEEQKEMDNLAIELGQQGAENNPELVAAINDYNSLPKSAPAAAPAFNAAKDSQKANITALTTELRAIADDTEKLGPNATPDNVQTLLDRLKKVQADADGAGEDVKSAVQAMVTNVEAELKKISGGAGAVPAAGAAAAGGTPGGGEAPWSYVEKGSDESYAINNGFVTGDGRADLVAWKAAGSPGKTDTANMKQNQAAAVRPPVAVDPRDGAVGQSLASMGVSKKDRLNQAFVDSTLGAGKYKAGSAESNMALQAHFKKQGSGSGAPSTQAAGSVPASGSLATGEKIIPDRKTSGMPVATGGNKAVAGLNKELPRNQFPPNQAAKTTAQKKNSKPSANTPNAQSTATSDGNVQDFTYESVGYNELQRIMSLVNHR